MKKNSPGIKITTEDWEGLNQQLFTPDQHENGAVLLCGLEKTQHLENYLVRKVVKVRPDEYIKRLPYHLEISPTFYNRVIDESIQHKLSPVVCHSHPFKGPARYSASDDHGEAKLMPVLGALLPESRPASLLVSESDVCGRRFHREGFDYFSRLTVIGPGIRITRIQRLKKEDNRGGGVFDRQLRAIGIGGQTILQNLKIGIVGLGGIGSLVAQELGRLGVEELLFIDPDVVEITNLNRLFGATADDIAKPKVHVIARELQELGARVTTIRKSVVSQAVLMQLRGCDLLFSCVDNDLARTVLSRFAHQYLIPTVDMGVRLDAREGRVTAAAGRVTLLGAGLGCLRCSHHTNPGRIRAESLSVQERNQLRQEGYVMGDPDDPTPAVVSINGVVASLGVTAGVNMFVNLTGAAQPIDQLYDATSGTVFTTDARHVPGCDICDSVRGLKGLGDSQVATAYP